MITHCANSAIADAQHHRAMPPYQLLEGGLLALSHKPFRQLTIRGLTLLGEVARPAQVAEKHIHGDLSRGRNAFCLYSSKEVRRVHYFWIFSCGPPARAWERRPCSGFLSRKNGMDWKEPYPVVESASRGSTGTIRLLTQDEKEER